MKQLNKALVFTLWCFFMTSCKHKAQQVQRISPDIDLSSLIHECNSTITDVIVGDGFSPLLASRAYVYPNLAAYEILQEAKKGARKRVSGFPDLSPVDTLIYCYELAAVQAFATVSKAMVYREVKCNELLTKQITFFRDSLYLDKEVLERSLAYGAMAGNKVISWSKMDNYSSTKGQPKYLFNMEDGGKWLPTPPEFRGALEPWWGTLRTVSGIKPNDVHLQFTIPFSAAKTSSFYNLVNEVYQKSKDISEEEKAIALYWDDNPDQITFHGHIPTTRRRISPASHWIEIAKETCKKHKLNIAEVARCYAMISVANADALICCWNQKYATNLIRPVTYIRKNIDPDWMPMIVTPPFPEFTSGHACISFASATVLSELFGDNCFFIDRSLLGYGLHERKFNSFYQAAEEASISRFYAGIHYKTSLEGGKASGKKIGQHVIKVFKAN
jgi:hypothetical protein